jgi:hypothetical protein
MVHLSCWPDSERAPPVYVDVNALGECARSSFAGKWISQRVCQISRVHFFKKDRTNQLFLARFQINFEPSWLDAGAVQFNTVTVGVDV